MKKITVSGVGCTLMDYVYNGVSFAGEQIRPFLSKTDGDGGISPGKLVFSDELENYSGKTYPEIIKIITGGKGPDIMNIGGPSVVSMIHAAQLLGDRAAIKFTGAIGNDETGSNLKKFIEKTPLDPSGLKTFDEPTPFTHVLSDPDYHNGQGERSFINNMGAARMLTDPGSDFFDADICVFGGTALVPGIHDNLDHLLSAAKNRNIFTVVNTVYDFRNEKKNPGAPWPLGKGHDCLNAIDLLIMDREEALKISGLESVSEAMDYFIEKQVRGVIITAGSEDISYYVSDRVFLKEKRATMPVSQKAASDLKCSGVKGDTTGCGDNFVGGLIYSLALQFSEENTKPDIEDLLLWGRASGGFACFYLGGTYYESAPGEKIQRVRRYLE